MTAIYPSHETLAAGLARAWMRLYTIGLPDGVRERREQQLESDLWEHQVDRLDANVAPSMVGLEVLGRTVRGMPADLLWRFQLEGPKMNIKLPFERATGLLLLLLVVLIPVSTAISGYDTSRDAWADELSRFGGLSDFEVRMNLAVQALAGIGLMAAAVMFYLSLASRSRNLAALAGAFMFTAGITTLAASAAYSVVAELADEYLNGTAGEGVLMTSRAFALAMDAFVMFTVVTLSLSVYLLAVLGHRERLVARWMSGIAVLSLVLIGAAFSLDWVFDKEIWWAFLMGGLLLLLLWLLLAGFSLLLGSRRKPSFAQEAGLSTT